MERYDIRILDKYAVVKVQTLNSAFSSDQWITFWKDTKIEQNVNSTCMFFDMEKYVYSESVFNTLYIEIKHKC